MNVFISLAFFDKVGFVIIPVATSISTWAGVIIYIYLLIQKNYLFYKENLKTNILKISLCSILMSFVLIFLLNNFAGYLEYSYKFKVVYLFLIVSFAASVYLITCYLAGILKTKNFKTN